MKTREKALSIFVSVVLASTGINAFAGTAMPAGKTQDSTAVHSRAPDECYAAMNRNWNRLAELHREENQMSEPLVMTQNADGAHMGALHTDNDSRE